MAEFQTYDEFMLGKKPKRQRSVMKSSRRTANVEEWNVAVKAGKVTSMQLQLYKLIRAGYGLHSPSCKSRAKRIERGYL